MILSAFPTPNCTNIAEEERIEAIKSKILSCGDSFRGGLGLQELFLKMLLEKAPGS